MKKFLLFFVFVYLGVSLAGQDYYVINFYGVNVSPENVIVKNLTQDTELTMQGNQTLHLVIQSVSVDDLQEFSESQLTIYPNPFEHSCNIEFVNLHSGRVTMHLHDNGGRLLHQFSDDLPSGLHTLLLKGLPAGSYFLSIQTITGLLSGKFIATGQAKSSYSLRHINQSPLKTTVHQGGTKASLASIWARSGNDIVEMDFWPGDEMLFVLIAEGFDNIGIYDSPDGNQTYNIEFTNWWPVGYEHCFVVPTEVVGVTNPTTGRTWMDRNLGAAQVASSLTDEAAYGDLYQWGRFADGHQCRDSGTTTALSNSDTPGHGDFIQTSSAPHDWRNPSNDELWQDMEGNNNPCPEGFRLPTNAEFLAELNSWPSDDAYGAFESALKFPLSGYRFSINGMLMNEGVHGVYWSSSIGPNFSRYMSISVNEANLGANYRALGHSIRCIFDEPIAPTVSTEAVTNIGTTTATSGGIVYFDGGLPVHTRGVVWSQSENPTIENNEGMTNDGAGLGLFASHISGLEPETQYYVRAYATNDAGTSFGNELSFETVESSLIWPEGYVHCGGTETSVVEVTNPATGKIWMDRNLGASQVAISSTDDSAYGDLYQWGRFADGHQCRDSETTSSLSDSDQPGHGDFIIGAAYPFDWRNPQNDNLWQGLYGTNNTCPEGYRLPTLVELDAERQSWDTNNAAGAFASALKLTVSGARGSNGSIIGVGTYSYYWTSNVHSNQARALFFQVGATNANMNYVNRAGGYSVRCIKE